MEGTGGGGAIGENGSKNMTRKGGDGLRKWRGGRQLPKKAHIYHAEAFPRQLMLRDGRY